MSQSQRKHWQLLFLFSVGAQLLAVIAEGIDAEGVP
jgi:hypothetical protein